MSAPKSCIEEKEIACQSPTSNRLTTSEELDEVFSPALPSNPDDVVFTSTQEHGRNRRFSEGTRWLFDFKSVLEDMKKF